MGLVSIGFLLFLLMTSNPFERLFPVPIEGRDLNPLLQDPGMAIHPPMLYMGYVGFSVAFAFAIAALIGGRLDSAWARWSRPWTNIAWVFLTLGITLGSWWAYYELGWGGWWAWDPSENASFMPWLVCTALIHSAIVVEKRETLKSWTILLALMAFSFSLLGTFVVRSGVLTSVHAFASDPERGLFILIFLGVVIGGSLLLYALRSDKIEKGGIFAPISRETGLLINNLLLMVAVAVVFFGTLYPLLLDGLTGEKISVGPPFFNKSFVPLMMPLVFIMGFAIHLNWKRADIKLVSDRLKFLLGGSILIVIMTYYVTAVNSLMGAVWFGLGAWLIFATFADLGRRIAFGKKGSSLNRLLRQPRATWGMFFGHFGMAVTVLGMAATSYLSEEFQNIMIKGQSTHIGGYDVTFEGVNAEVGPNYTALRGNFKVQRAGVFVIQLRPATRTYITPPQNTTEAALHTMPSGDLFVVIGGQQMVEVQGKKINAFAVRIYHKTMQVWVWIGIGIMVFGGLISLSDRRFRVGVPKKKNKTFPQRKQEVES
jgi:cytochrome c-type biogenesis protein CcmF